MRVIGIRMGYSLICWVVGLAAFVGSIFYLMKFGPHGNRSYEIYKFYSALIVPIFATVGIISILVRPFFLIMISKLYTHVIPLDLGITIAPQRQKFNFLTLLFVILLSTVLILYFFGDQLGVRQWVESIAAKGIKG
jgi:hypothetical protein